MSAASGDPGAAADTRSKVESMLVMSGGEGYIDFRIGEWLAALPFSCEDVNKISWSTIFDIRRRLRLAPLLVVGTPIRKIFSETMK